MMKAITIAAAAGATLLGAGTAFAEIKPATDPVVSAPAQVAPAVQASATSNELTIRTDGMGLFIFIK